MINIMVLYTGGKRNAWEKAYCWIPFGDTVFFLLFEVFWGDYVHKLHTK